MSIGKIKRKKSFPANCATSFISTLLLSTALLSAAVSADDTEVFFGQLEGGTNPYPNVMFLLDTSDSMILVDEGHVGSRMSRLREALHNMIDSVDKVNVGMMRLNGPAKGGTVIAPVRPINDSICQEAGCTEIPLDLSIANGNDDVVEHTVVATSDSTDPTLSLGGAGKATGLRYANTLIPQGATITSAELVFRAAQNSSSTTDLEIAVVAADDMQAFDSATSNPGSMATGASISWNNVDTWQTDNTYTSPSVTTLVQQIVNRADYCGGNAIGFIVTGTGERVAKSFEHADSDNAPVLRVTYDSASIPEAGGCLTREAVSHIDHSSADAYEVHVTGFRNRDADFLYIPYNNIDRAATTALRFNGLNIPQGATIVSASVELEVHTAQSGEMQVDITAEDSSAASRYNSNIINRAVIDSSVSWLQTSAPAVNTKVHTPDLSVLVQQVVNRSDWAAESPLSLLFMGNSSSPGYRKFKGVSDSNVRFVNKETAPRLTIRYQTKTTPLSLGIGMTAREELKRVVDEMGLTYNTPLVGTHYEAANYFLGRDVEMGLFRGNEQRQNRVSHPDSYTGGSLTRDLDCNSSNLSSDACGSEEISPGASYISPIANSCQSNHIVILSDGESWGNPPATEIADMTGLNCAFTPRYAEYCGIELSQWLFDTDHDSVMEGKQNIQTHSIGFNIKQDFLQNVATAGGGKYYDASSAEELTDVFLNIVSDISSTDSTFVAPATSISQFNRLEHDSELYFALHTPNDSPRWNGNLKRFELHSDADGDVSIVDKNGNLAVDPATGFFTADSHSFWSSSQDGGSVAQGGAAEQLDTLADTRNVSTDAGIDTIPAGGLLLNDADRRLHENNPGITQASLGIAGLFNNDEQRAAYRKQLLDWARGSDINDEDMDGSTTDRRAFIGDPLHSAPVVVNYNTGTNWERQILMSTNEGFLHSIDSDSGSENWAFMPKELLGNLHTFYTNSPTRVHSYGLDGPLSVWIDDTNGNTAIDSGEDAYLFVGMRRGGHSYYAFDISKKDNPRLAWAIHGGVDEGFEELGQTWSKMLPTTVMINGNVKDVLVFGAGYSSAQDDQESAQTFDSEGRGLYMVDARTGEKLWSGLASTASGSGLNQVFADMQYSMPGNLRVLDVDLDGLADQMYASDTGGRVWRFDIAKYHQSGNLVDGGIMADLGREALTSTPHNERRFYYEPDVALNSVDGERYLSIAIGSGWRAHPLDDVVQDRIYVIRSNAVLSKPDGYGMQEGSGDSGYWRPIMEYDLADVTTDLNPTGIEHGWMLKLGSVGEKVLARTLTVNSQLIVTTYTPAASADLCAASIGSSSIYVMNIADGSPTLDLNEDGAFTLEDRVRGSIYAGIAPEPSALITSRKGVITVGPSQPLPEFDFGELLRKMYWRDRGKNADELSLHDE